MVGGGEGESRQGLLEPGPEVRAELLACCSEARQDCQATAAIVASKEDPILPTYGKGLHGSFSEIVVHRQYTVGDIDV